MSIMKLTSSMLIQLNILLSTATFITSDVLIYNFKTRNLEMEFKDVPSRFGDVIPWDGIRGFVVYSNPAEACTAIQSPPNFNNHTEWIVLIKRYGCQFEDKVRNAQRAGYLAAIVHNVNSSSLEPMSGNNPYDIHIPSVFIGSESGMLIKENYLYDHGYYIFINDDVPFNFTTHLLLIFSVLVGLCFFLMVFFIIVKYFKERRRQRRHRLPKSSLKEIPIHKFKKNDPYEMCAICLEEYVENDKLRVLPCSHAYHSKCIDPWLTKNRRVCPVCKRKVFASGESVTDSDTDTEDETAPLVRSSANTTNAGTFTRPVESRVRRAMTRRDDSGTRPASSSTSNSTSSSGGSNISNSIPSMHRVTRIFRRAANPERITNLTQEPSINSTESVDVGGSLPANVNC